MKKAAIVVGSLLFIVVACNPLIDQESVENTSKASSFNINPIAPGSESTYDLSLKLDDEGEFTVEASIEVQNVSNEGWDTLVFYFIPNMFTEENSTDLKQPSNLEVDKITLNGKAAEYSLEKDTFTIPLSQKLPPQESINVTVNYTFTLPEEGHRFTKKGSSFYLAQWYPMVPTYRNGWNKEEYQSKGESYHTAFSNFKLHYEVPKGYTVVSSSEQDKFPSGSESTLLAQRMKELYVAVLYKPDMSEGIAEDTNVRVFNTEDTNRREKVVEIASEAIKYFEDTIGPYPHQQLDIILSDLSMEYSGIVTVDNGTKRIGSLKSLVVHEVAHQWFYGMVNNDPYYDAWLDEGLTTLSSSLFFAHKGNKEMPNEFNSKPKPVNLPIDQYPEKYGPYIYGNSSVGLWKVFEKYGDRQVAEDFLHKYYRLYKYKEVDTEEFIRFLKHFLNIEGNSDFEGWLKLEEGK
ncbi:M1 family metallopeptidase [Halobacillus shinanisalinarum]|uniref:M1 family metallopeptidase n=1 Tax=Halobacillus shinanisalinarum TaxID=2932258 RepID=A0ABY4GVM2_9BACI|nr:M1 family metallopeptidase [Halobacillus shinanisalinarum]UOQ92216.1 M1 family metallopeptidase [Halobacillus shinanisalinarum]